MLSRTKLVVVGVAGVFILGLAVSWFLGGLLYAPSKRKSEPLSSDLKAETIQIHSASGSVLSGWYVPAIQDDAPIVILMHAVRGCREDMVERAIFLHAAGYATLLFDFQAHGDSPGEHITFGYLESRDAQAVVDFARAKNPKAKVGIIGVSMGGAAALLANPPLQVDAMVLESVYPDIERAVENRVVMRLGRAGKIFTPLLTSQIRLRLGISTDQLRPIDGVAELTVPKYFFAGAEDRHTTLAEANELYAAAAEPKEFWAVEGMRHVNLHRASKQEYERRVLDFFSKTLK